MDKLWHEKPKDIEMWKNDINFVVFLDENNSANFNTIKNKIKYNQNISDDDKYFTLTGCIINPFQYEILKDEFETLKLKHWLDGLYYDVKKQKMCKICFHSNEIRKRKKAFNDNIINNNDLIIDISKTISKIDFNIISVSIDIKNYINKDYKYDLYNVCFDILIENIIYSLPNDVKIQLMFEARGKKEDTNLYKHIKNVIRTTGTKNISYIDLSDKIMGAFFNNKWNCDNTKTYAGLELADLCSYPIHKYVKTNIKDKAFKIIEPKLDSFPNYIDKGLIIFP